MDLSLSLIIPVFNEEKNLPTVLDDLKNVRAADPHFLKELIFVNNGSSDESLKVLHDLSKGLTWVKIGSLDENAGYGGGIEAGFKHSDISSTHLGWMPADGQYQAKDLLEIWKQVLVEPNCLHKGWRKNRADNFQSKMISFCFTQLTKRILELNIIDINGLPKIFPRTFLEKVSFPLESSFLLDAQIVLAAKRFGLQIKEHPVTFLRRKEGVSSWSKKRLQTYLSSIDGLIRMRLDATDWFRVDEPLTEGSLSMEKVDFISSEPQWTR